MTTEYPIAHEQTALRRLYFEQAKPIQGSYSRPSDDYVARVLNKGSSQPNDLGNLAQELYSSRKPLEIKKCPHCGSNKY